MVLRDLTRGETPKKRQEDVTLQELMERLIKELKILALLRDPESQFRKDYEAFVAATGERCPLLEGIRRGDAYHAAKKRESCSTEWEEIPDFAKESEEN